MSFGECSTLLILVVYCSLDRQSVKKLYAIPMWRLKLYAALNSNCNFFNVLFTKSSKLMFCSNGTKFYFIADYDHDLFVVSK